MKKLVLLLMICCMCTACGPKEETTVNESSQKEETVQDAEGGENESEVSEYTKVFPHPSTIDMNALDNCTLAVSFEKGDAYVDDTGAMQLKVTVYTYDLYDMVDIANLKVGDTIVIQGNEVLVDSMETSETGIIFINGGMDNGGYDLWHDESGVYFEHGYNDMKSYYPIGEATIRVSTEFRFVDASDLDKGEVTYYPGDFLTDIAGIIYYFNPNNTSIVIEDGKVIHMTRSYTP